MCLFLSDFQKRVRQIMVLDVGHNTRAVQIFHARFAPSLGER